MRYVFDLTLKKNWSGTITDVTGTVDAVPYPPMPGLLRFRSVRQENDMFYAVCDLPGPSAADVVTQELTVQVGTDAPQVFSYPPETAVTDEFQVGPTAGATVVCSLVDVDASGNRSEPRVAQGVVTDEFAPPQPGELTFRTVRQD